MSAAIRPWNWGCAVAKELLTLDEALAKCGGKVTYRPRNSRWRQVSIPDGWQSILFQLSDYVVQSGADCVGVGDDGWYFYILNPVEPEHGS